jgi:hypothetical protein
LPGSNEEKTFEAPLPKDFEITKENLRNTGNNLSILFNLPVYCCKFFF